jgi:PAS domain S-box-containing protein
VWALIGAAYICLYALWLWALPKDDALRQGVGNLALILPEALAAVAALSIGRTSLHTRFRQAWVLLGLALVAWTLGDIVLAFYKRFLRMEAPLPSLADPVSLLGYPLALAGLLSFPVLPRVRFGRIRILMDLTITSGAITVLGWLVVVRPVLSSASPDPARVLWGAILPIADLALLLFLLNVFFLAGPGELRSALGFVSAGLAAFAVTDLAYNYFALTGQYRIGSPVELGWILGHGLVGLGALYQREGRPPSPAPVESVPRFRFAHRVQALLPLATTFALGWYTLLDWQVSGRTDPLALWTTALLSLALVARQGVVAGEIELMQYAHLVNSAADPAFVCDANGRLQLVNPALLAVSGYDLEEDLVGHAALELLAPGTLFQEKALHLENLFTLGMERGWSGEVSMRRRDGTELPVYLSLRPVRSDAISRPAVVGTAHDLTEPKRQQAALMAAYEEVAAARRALEELNAQLEQKVAEKTHSLSEAYAQLAQQNEALQTLDRSKSEFVSLVSHELRAPLANVAGGIELILTRPGTLPVKLTETLQIMQAEIRRLTQFVETILDLSALDAGRLPLYPLPLPLASVIENVRSRFAAVPAGERLRFAVPETLPLALADERGLTSVLFHLVDNALKYAPEGEVVVEAEARAGRVDVRVRDHGPGIAPEAREQIFEKFQRLNSGDAQSVYGHGLGLYMVRRLLQAMGSDIQMEPAPGGGAQFAFWLPAAEDEDA